MNNSIQARLQAQSFKRYAETFLGRRNFSWLALVLAVSLFIVAGWLPDGIAEILLCQWQTAWYKIALSVLILLWISIRLKRSLRYDEKISVREYESPPAKVLGLFLSISSLKSENIKKFLDDNNLTAQDIKKKFEGNQWEMPLLAIDYHNSKSTLQCISVFTSSGDGGTTVLMPTFSAVVKKIYPNLEIKEFKPGGIDFENIKEVFDAVEEFYVKALSAGLKEHQILIDVTGGQKTNSISAAIVTLAQGRSFQYISTRKKDKVHSYDIGYLEE